MAKSKNTLGAIARFGTLIYVESGWVVKLNFDGTVEQLFKVSDESISIRIEDHKAYVSRPINTSEHTYDEIYDCYGKLDKEETEESLQWAKTHAQYNSNKEAISELVNDATNNFYTRLGEIILLSSNAYDTTFYPLMQYRTSPRFLQQKRPYLSIELK